MKCPFNYANGKQCSGYIDTIEFIKADVVVRLDNDNQVTNLEVTPSYHIHLFCSEKGNHAGYARPHSEQMKVWNIPDEVWAQIEKKEPHRREQR